MKTVIIIGILCVLAITPAWAHAFIDHTDPPVGGTVKKSPAQVLLWFTEALESAFSSVNVADASGKEVDKRDIRIEAKNPHQMSVSLPAALGAGTYKVTWRAVSVDTHVTQGSFTFIVSP